MCIRSPEIDGAADAMTSIRDKVAVAITGSGTIYKRGEGGVNSAIVLGLETDIASAVSGSSFQKYLGEVVSAFVEALAMFIGKTSTCLSRNFEGGR